MTDYYNINGTHLTYVKYDEIHQPKSDVKSDVKSPVVEHMTPYMSDLYSAATGNADISSSGHIPTTNLPKTISREVYDMDPSGNVMNYPVGHPKYQPSLQDTRIQDAQSLQQQENTMFMIGTIAGFSLIALSFMIYKQQASA